MLTFFKENFDSAINENSLFHGESLLVVTTGNSKSISLELWANDFTINVRSHSTIVEMTTISNNHQNTHIFVVLTWFCHHRFPSRGFDLWSGLKCCTIKQKHDLSIFLSKTISNPNSLLIFLYGQSRDVKYLNTCLVQRSKPRRPECLQASCLLTFILGDQEIKSFGKK